MKSFQILIIFSGFLFGSAMPCASLDREAFTFTNYDLNVRLEPRQQRLAVRGSIRLRNDSPASQKVAVLQISSSLSWRSIRVEGEQVQIVSQPYSSDIDHTGALTEAIVTLPKAVGPKDSVDLEVAYEGVVVLDATRLIRIGTPENAAHSTDWDKIDAKFIGVRGVGYVTWYPIASDAANLSSGNNTLEAVGRWMARETASTMRIQFTMPDDDVLEKPELLVNAASCSRHRVDHQWMADCIYQPLASITPAFAMADYQIVERSAIAVHYLHGHESSATAYADAAESLLPFITEWFGSSRGRAETVDLPGAEDAPFESGGFLLTPLAAADPKSIRLVAAHQLTHAAFFSSRPWIDEGLAHFSQALTFEQLSGRKSALDYMRLHEATLRSTERANQAGNNIRDAGQSLINSADPALYRGKAMYVWWMLRDMLGDTALKKALAAYHADQDKMPSYMAKLIQAQTQRDLEWFFDDWVYRDRGLPDFKVESAFARKTLPEGFLIAITVSNSGEAGAEVPVVVKFEGGEVSKRLEVRGKSNAVIRVQIPKAAEEIIVNDGSVPEAVTTNNLFKIPDASRAPRVSTAP